MNSEMHLYLPNGAAIPVKGTKRGVPAMYKALPDYATLVRAGKVFGFLDTTTNAALVARPTTLSSVTVQNPASSPTYKVVFSLLAYTDVVGAGLATISLWHCVHKLAAAALTRDLVLQGTGAGSATAFLSGKNYDGDLIVDRGATVADDGWIPVGEPLVSNIATTNFLCKEMPLVVPVIIPPGQHYSLQTVATVITYETALGMVWAELEKEEIE